MSYESVALQVNDYIDFCGERFWVTERYTPKQKSTVEWEYNVSLYGIESLIKRYLVLKLVNDAYESEFSYTATAYDHVALIVASLNYGMETSDWKVGEVIQSEYITIDYEGTYCDAGAKQVAEKCGVERIEGMTMNSRCEHSEPITLGYNNGLTSVEPSKADNVKFFTRLFPIGGTRNINYDDYGSSRLQLPNGVKYLDQDVDKFGVIHHYEKEAFAHIYPRRIGKVSSVRSEEHKSEDGTPFTIFYFKDSSMNFNPNDYKMGETISMMVSFQDNSALAGRDFEVNYNDETKEFEIITQWPYDNDLQLPNEDLPPKKGDEYILWNVKMPRSITHSEAEFKEAVDEFIAKQHTDVSVYKAHTD